MKSVGKNITMVMIAKKYSEDLYTRIGGLRLECGRTTLQSPSSHVVEPLLIERNVSVASE